MADSVEPTGAAPDATADSEQAIRFQRQAAALRANLRKRRQQKQEREAKARQREDVDDDASHVPSESHITDFEA